MVRPFTEPDRSQIIALWNDVFADDPPWNAPDVIIDTKLKVQPGLFFVCVDLSVSGQREIVGTTLAGFDGVRGWMHHVATHSAHRRRGIASLMMAKAAAGLEALGCPKLNLQVRATNQAVVRFYESLAYVVEDRIRMGKRLGSNGQ